MRELKIGDRVVHWNGESGTVLETDGDIFTMRFEHNGQERSYGWIEYNGEEDGEWCDGTFRFEDTEYPEWPR